MTIKAKLRIIAVLPLLVFVMAAAIQYWAYHVLNGLYAKGAVVDELSRTHLSLVSLTYEYGLNRTEPAATRWREKLAEEERLLLDIRDVASRPVAARLPFEELPLEELQQLLRKLPTIFSGLYAHDNRLAPDGGADRVTESWNTQVNRIILELRTAKLLIEKIHAGINETTKRLVRYGSLLTMGIVLSLAFSLFILACLVISVINRSLLKVRSGMEAVAGGDLDSRLHLATGDELGELARCFDEMTEKLAMVTVSRDQLAREIVERGQAEEKLAASEEKLMAAQRIAGFGSWTLDHDSKVLLWSDGIYRIFEIDPKDFGASYEAFLNAVHPEDRDMVNQAYIRSLETRQPYDVEHRLLMADGRIKYVHERCETHFDGNGKPLLSCGTVQDVSERKQAEAEIRRLNEKLELRVTTRTRDLEAKTQEVEATQRALMNIVEDLNYKSTELEEANLKLQDLDRLKSMFIAAMSHELRTPLNSIIGFSSIVQEEWLGPLNKEQKEKLAIVLRTGKHLLSLINDLIDVSKIEAGKLEVIIDEFDLYDLIVEAAALTESDLAARGIKLEVEAIHQILHADRRRLYQCVVNLLGNAAKFTRQGLITVKARLVQDPGGHAGREQVVISITDTGIGIREEDLPKLFCSFVRLPLPEDMQVKGTGLGLYLVKKIVTDVLGGTVSATSVYGQGSEFCLTVPVKPL